MPAIVMTREIAYCCGTDAANRQMRKAGRKAWNQEDRTLAIRTQTTLWTLEDEYPWASPEDIARMKRDLGYDW